MCNYFCFRIYFFNSIIFSRENSLLDREGRVVKKYVGYRDLEVFEEDIRPLL